MSRHAVWFFEWTRSIFETQQDTCIVANHKFHKSLGKDFRNHRTFAERLTTSQRHDITNSATIENCCQRIAKPPCSRNMFLANTTRIASVISETPSSTLVTTLPQKRLPPGLQRKKCRTNRTHTHVNTSKQQILSEELHPIDHDCTPGQVQLHQNWDEIVTFHPILVSGGCTGKNHGSAAAICSRMRDFLCLREAPSLRLVLEQFLDAES